MRGARQGKMTALQRIVASAMSRDLHGFVVPGANVARAAGLDLGAAGLHLSSTPRHANVLVVIGPLDRELAAPASIAYAQMPRPRAILALGSGDLASLRDADVTGPLTQTGLVMGMAELRHVFATGAFQPDVEDFDAPALRTRTEYTCPMHPEIVQDEPGNCPKCGMTLVVREAAMSPHAGHAMSEQDHEAPAETQSDPMTEGHDDTKSAHNGHGGGHSHDHGSMTHAAAEAPAQYTCPMHPEVVSDEPGSCPKCGMFLVPADTKEEHGGHGAGHGHDQGPAIRAAAEAPAQYTCPMHPEVVSDEPGSCPKCGMFLVPADTKEEHGEHGGGHSHEHGSMTHAAAEVPAQYTCPMHPEVVSDEPGSCPKCGMFLVPADTKEEHGEHGAGHGHDQGPAKHVGHDHGSHSNPQSHDSKGGPPGDHGSHGDGEVIDGVEAHFMSMVDLTRDMPSSTDGLKMEWIDVPFGPFFPGLPGGLQLHLTLDGDAVTAANADSAADIRDLLLADATAPGVFADRLAALSPLSPVAYRQLACLALEQAAGQSVAPDVARARIAAVERERVASHFGWLAELGAQSGFGWLEKRAAAFQLKLREATPVEIDALTPKITALLSRSQRTPLLTARLKGIGRLAGDDTLSGPLARAAGIARDARSDDPVYADLGFTVLTRDEGDALARLALRCGEISQSIELISQAGAISLPKPHAIGAASGTGVAVVETPRGAARLSLTLDKGKVTAAEIETPTAAHIALVATVAQGRELGDALTGIGSLDISPWEVTA